MIFRLRVCRVASCLQLYFNPIQELCAPVRTQASKIIRDTR